MRNVSEKRAVLLITATALTAVVGSGCFRYEQSIVLDADGTAQVTVSYSVPRVLTDEERELSPAILPDAGAVTPLYDEETAALKSAFRRFGVDVTDASVADDGDFLTYAVTGTVADPDALGSVLPYFDEHKTEYKADEKTARFKETIENDLSEVDRPTDEEKPLLEALFPDCGFTFRVVMPGPVKDTNGTVGADGRTVEWRFGLAEFLFAEKVEMWAETTY
ncbi:MAG: hypothetical protein JSW52_10495 [Candidatus Coatesbacteria bacterium]|nr:MAG: hypothetical protein JSW52_10495 [Candidatus Coatesbacteria bacterium]